MTVLRGGRAAAWCCHGWRLWSRRQDSKGPTSTLQGLNLLIQLWYKREKSRISELMNVRFSMWNIFTCILARLLWSLALGHLYFDHWMVIANNATSALVICAPIISGHTSETFEKFTHEKSDFKLLVLNVDLEIDLEIWRSFRGIVSYYDRNR